MKKLVFILFSLALGTILLSNIQCGNNTSKPESVAYLNHNDTVKYIGKEQCRACHASIYNSFIETGMGKSFNVASKTKSTADFSKKHVVYDKFKDFYYIPYWKQDSFYIMEFRLQGKDTIHKRIERVDYIIGSGQHTNSHFTNINGYVYQLPLTWYAQKGKWDLPPGYENGRNVRFTRAIEFECMSCHNAMPTVADNSINKFTSIPDGIDCERCHGPGELHLREKLAGHIVDTAHSIDYTIVNPKKLPWERQIDLCQRCHLQGNAILKKGKSFRDFRPGMVLSDFYDVFMPRYKGNDEAFIMASHAQRLQLSKCFIESSKNSNGVGKADGLTCINCHNPHVSVKVTGKETFNNACLKCHQSADACKEKNSVKITNNNNCVACHMPKSGTIDIPHVTVHDHWIRKPAKQKDIESMKSFAGIYCINNPESSALIKANALMNYVEKFEGEKSSLDSANSLLNAISKDENVNDVLDARIHLLYLQNQDEDIIAQSRFAKIADIKNPWMTYRVGQAFQNVGDAGTAENWYGKAVELAPENLEFINKWAGAKIQLEKNEEAIAVLDRLLSKNPKLVDAFVNKGFALLKLNRQGEAMACYNQALQLDCDNHQALLNRSGLLHLMGKDEEAKKDLKHLLKLNPQNKYVKDLLSSL